MSSESSAKQIGADIFGNVGAQILFMATSQVYFVTQNRRTQSTLSIKTDTLRLGSQADDSMGDFYTVRRLKCSQLCKAFGGNVVCSTKKTHDSKNPCQ